MTANHGSAAALSPALKGPNDLRRDPAKPDYQRKDHKQNPPFCFDEEGPGRTRAFPFEAPMLLPETRSNLRSRKLLAVYQT